MPPESIRPHNPPGLRHRVLKARELLEKAGNFLIHASFKLTLISSLSLAAAQTVSGGGLYLYDCPADVPQAKAKNDIGGYFDWVSAEEHEEGEEADASYFLDAFRTAGHGGQQYTYAQYKEMARDFRAEVFGNELKNGDSIYEGAGAEGFNLLATLEILREERDITGLTAYGHDYMGPFVEVANKLLDAQLSLSQQPRTNGGHWMKKGRYCQGDSTDLHFVPSNAFDFAYTYIDVLIDGLGRHDENVYAEDRADEMSMLCSSQDENDRLIVKQDQQLQERWHSDWVKELIRIVKPGKLIVVENICGPICDPDSLWGGVSERWWKEAAATYGWDVDIGSIELYRKSRFSNGFCNKDYHVAMRKNKEVEGEYCADNTAR